MIIATNQPIWVACGTDDTRPIQQFVNIEATGEPENREGNLPAVAVALDGFVCAVVPCLLEPDDVPGLVHREALQWARRCTRIRQSKHDDPRLMFTLNDDHLRLRNGMTIPRQNKGVGAEFPDWRTLLTKTFGPKPDDETHPFDVRAFNIALFTKVCAAMGATMVKTIQFSAKTPFLIEPIGAQYPKPPYAFVMPCRIDDGAMRRWRDYKPEPNGQAKDTVLP